MNRSIVLHPLLFGYNNTFKEIVSVLFIDMIDPDQVQGGKIDIYLEDKILNIAYINGQGVLIAQKNFNRKDIKLNEKS